VSASVRIGQGFDAHRFVDGGRLVLGGVHIPHAQGLEAHSDGDCLIHAVIDALLGAAALGDIGRLFPDTDPGLAGIDSRRMLVQVRKRLEAAGYAAGNVDATIVAQRPRLAEYIERMRANIAADLRADPDAVNVKATTTEHMGFTGRGEGVAALAVATIRERG